MSKAAKVESIYDDFAPPPPEDFDDRSRPDVHGWHYPEQMATVMGTIVGFLMYDGDYGPQRAVCIRLTFKTKAKLKGGEEVILQPGQVIAIGEKNDLAEMWDYDVGTGVWFRPLRKDRIDGGRTVWKYELKIARDARKVTRSTSGPNF